jgi:hypothetical protein
LRTFYIEIWQFWLTFSEKMSFGAPHSSLFIITKWKIFNQKIIDHGLLKVHLLLYTGAYLTQQNSSRDPYKIPFKALGKFSSYVYFWRAPYAHKHPSQNRGGILHLFLKSGKHIMPTHRCKICLALKE